MMKDSSVSHTSYCGKLETNCWSGMLYAWDVLSRAHTIAECSHMIINPRRKLTAQNKTNNSWKIQRLESLARGRTDSNQLNTKNSTTSTEKTCRFHSRKCFSSCKFFISSERELRSTILIYGFDQHMINMNHQIATSKVILIKCYHENTHAHSWSTTLYGVAKLSTCFGWR